MGELSDLDFDLGTKFASLVLQRFNCSVSPTAPYSSSDFHLVATFGRSAIRLNEDLVGLILQSCLGGIAKNFNVFHLSGWMFSFAVSCKKVGCLSNFFASRLLFSSIFEGGGPNWKKDFAIWCSEQAKE